MSSRRGVGIGQRLLAFLLRSIDALADHLGASTEGTAAHLATGVRGEEEAFFYLRQHGYILVARRWKTPKLPGDVDLIGWEGETLCFIEVKTRTGRDIVPAEFSVDAHKQETLRKVAAIFRKRFPEPMRSQIPFRFDVVSVYLPAPGTDAEVEIELFPAAFGRHGR
jgi:putative endonuclease